MRLSGCNLEVGTLDILPLLGTKGEWPRNDQRKKEDDVAITRQCIYLLLANERWRNDEQGDVDIVRFVDASYEHTRETIGRMLYTSAL